MRVSSPGIEEKFVTQHMEGHPELHPFNDDALSGADCRVGLHQFKATVWVGPGVLLPRGQSLFQGLNLWQAGTALEVAYDLKGSCLFLWEGFLAFPLPCFKC